MPRLRKKTGFLAVALREQPRATALNRAQPRSTASQPTGMTEQVWARYPGILSQARTGA